MAATAASPPPLLVIVSGKPGSGKSTLAQRLAERDALGLPLLSRDAIKVELVETHATPETGARRWTVETDVLRATIVPRSYAIFYQTIEAWLRAGVSLIAEYGFVRGRSESDLRPLIKLARAVVVHCETSPEEARRRFIARERSDPHSRPDRLAGIIEQMEGGHLRLVGIRCNGPRHSDAPRGYDARLRACSGRYRRVLSRQTDKRLASSEHRRAR
jgi:predicted kinase